ncbi:MAG: cytochrome c biogenesis CcdA family protein [Acidimicrobiales bacterium]
MITDLVALFGAGVASFLAPCVVPLVPAYLGLIVGEAGDAGDTAKVVPATAVFIVGFATVYAALGVLAGGIGSSLDGLQTWVERVGGLIVIVMGLALLGVLRGRFATAELRPVQRLPKSGALRPFVLGIGFGAAWSPCVGPLLGAAITVAATRGDPWGGGVLLLAYALGIGVPFLAASLGLAASPGLAGRLRRIAPKVERVGGVLLVALGILLATGLYGHLTSYLARFTPASGGL